MFDFRRYRKTHPKLTLNPQGRQQSLGLRIDPIDAESCFPHDNIVGKSLVWRIHEINLAVCRKPESILWLHEQVCWPTTECRVCRFVPGTSMSMQFVGKLVIILQLIQVLPVWIDGHPNKDLTYWKTAPLTCLPAHSIAQNVRSTGSCHIQAFQKKTCEHTVCNSPTDLSSSFLNWWSSKHGLETLYYCSTFLFASSQSFNAFLSMSFHVVRTRFQEFASKLLATLQLIPDPSFWTDGRPSKDEKLGNCLTFLCTNSQSLSSTFLDAFHIVAPRYCFLREVYPPK